MDNWSASKTDNPQGADFREVFIDGKVSELEFTIKPQGDYWRAGFKLFDPNEDIFPLRSNNSFLFHLGSTPPNKEYGLTAYLNGDHIKELNKTKKYPNNKLINIKLEINHNNFLKIYINGSLEFKPNWHFKNPNVREKIILIAWGDEFNYHVYFKNIAMANWKDIKKKEQTGNESDKTPATLKVTGNKNVFLNSQVNGSAFISGKENAFIKTNINSTKINLIKKTKWYKNPKIIVPAIVGIFTAPWWPSIFSGPSEYPNSSIGQTNTPTIVEKLIPLSMQIPQKIADSNNVIFVDESKSFTDSSSGLIVGINRVLSHTDSDLTITFPGKPSEEMKDIKSGKSFLYKGKDNLEYALIIVEIASDSVGIKINLNSEQNQFR
ncbi:MAG: hypothetical protein WCT51_01175 [Candidatus Shapirobacteria bacterium]|jgi:hypothetical protein